MTAAAQDAPSAAAYVAKPPAVRSRRAKIAEHRELSRRVRFACGLASIVVLLGFWQLAADERWVNPLLSSSPSGIVSSARTMIDSGVLGNATAQTAELFGLGFALSLGSGLVIGIVLGWYKIISAFIDPYVSALYSAPRLALIPLITVWAGIGFQAQLVIVWMTAVFPIIINVAAGVSTFERSLFTMARSFTGSNRTVLRTVVLPGAMPSLVSGVRQGLAQALIGVVVAEYFVGNNGIGGLIISAGETLDAGQAFVGVIVFSAAALVLTALLRMVERRLVRWQR